MGPKKQKNNDSKPPDEEKVSCKACTWTGKSIKTHLQRTKENCKNSYSEEDFSGKTSTLF